MKILWFALVVAAIVVCALFFQRHAPAIIEWIDTLGLLAPVFFLLLYGLATILFLPTMALTLAGGALFGPILGTIFNLLGASLGAICAFFLSRYMASDWVAKKKNLRLEKLILGVERQGWQFVALLRLIPIIPFNVVNYGLGLTRIKFTHYLVATIIFLIPAEIFFTYCGYAGMDILLNSQAFFKTHSVSVLLCLGIAAFLFIGIKRHRRNLFNSTASGR
jgi:uncharacterized membrane protein YdjX (TVP38/TMEM64 family)